MLLEEETFKEYGYYSTDFSYGSNKPILIVCDYCNKQYKSSNKKRYVCNKSGHKDACYTCKTKKRYDKSTYDDNSQALRNQYGESKMKYNFCSDEWTQDEIEILSQYYGKTKISNIPIKRSKQSIRMMAFKLGLKSNRTLMNKIYSVNEKFFNIPNITNCYYAGLIAADGCIFHMRNRSTTLLQLSLTDKHIVEEFIRDIEYNGKLELRNSIRSNKTQYSVRITSTKICNDLKKHWNIVPRKSLILQPPHIVDFNLINSFILGYLDGNGWCRLNDKNFTIGFCSASYDIIKWIYDKLNINTKILSRHNKETGVNVYNFSKHGIDAFKIMTELYSLGTPCLNRKKKGFNNAKQLFTG